MLIDYFFFVSEGLLKSKKILTYLMHVLNGVGFLRNFTRRFGLNYDIL